MNLDGMKEVRVWLIVLLRVVLAQEKTPITVKETGVGEWGLLSGVIILTVNMNGQIRRFAVQREHAGLCAVEDRKIPEDM